MLRFQKYRLPFLKSFQTATGTFSDREGIIIQGKILGMEFIGEAAPLPGFSRESLAEAERFLTENSQAISKVIEDEERWPESDSQWIRLKAPSSVRFALSTAMVGLMSKKHGLSLSRYINPESSLEIPINFTLGVRPDDELIKSATSAWDQGYKTFKLKVGIDFNREYKALNTLRQSFPHVGIRIDANGAWGVNEAIGNLKRLEPLFIEYCEQPVSAANSAGMAAVKKGSSIPIAADESVRDLESANDIIDLEAAEILILKPMLIGTITEFTRITKLAHAAGIGITVTSSLESGVGRLASAHMAASLGLHPYAHGLGTGTMLADDILNDQERIHNGSYKLPAAPGLGISLPLLLP